MENEVHQACRDTMDGYLGGLQASLRTLGKTQLGLWHVGGGEHARYSVPKVLTARRLHAEQSGLPVPGTLCEGAGGTHSVLGVQLASWEGWVLCGAGRGSRAAPSCYALGGGG